MWAGMEGISPALAAPGSNSYGNDNGSAEHTDGKSRLKKQALSAYQIALVNDYLKFAWKLTAPYHGKGFSHDELRAGAEDGLLYAAQNFDPAKGWAFVSYARPCIKGGIQGLFKKKKVESLSDSGTAPVIDRIVDENPPMPAVDVGALDERERVIFKGRVEGKTLDEIGKDLNVSRERVRQLTEPIFSKVGSSEYNAKVGLCRALIGRRGYKAPSRRLMPFKAVKYPGRTYSPDELAAFVASRPDLEGPR